MWDLALQQPVTTRLQAPDGQQLAAWGVQLAGHSTEVGQSTVHWSSVGGRGALFPRRARHGMISLRREFIMANCFDYAGNVRGLCDPSTRMLVVDSGRG